MGIKRLLLLLLGLCLRQEAPVVLQGLLLLGKCRQQMLFTGAMPLVWLLWLLLLLVRTQLGISQTLHRHEVDIKSRQ
jgi:hypothetical protein